MTDLRLQVSDLVDRPGGRREESGTLDVDLRVGESTVTGDARVEAVIEGMDNGVVARFAAKFNAHLVCNRCLRDWDEPMEIGAVQVFEQEPDDDGYGLGPGDTIDLAGPARDEIALAIPIRPLCAPDCLGLCPTCGSDLNESPCEGHDEEPESPFAVLAGLLDSADTDSADTDSPDTNSPDTNSPDTNSPDTDSADSDSADRESLARGLSQP